MKGEIEKGNDFYINPISYYEIKRGLLAINIKYKKTICRKIYIFVEYIYYNRSQITFVNVNI